MKYLFEPSTESLRLAIEYIEDGQLDTAMAHLRLAARELQDAIDEDAESAELQLMAESYGD